MTRRGLLLALLANGIKGAKDPAYTASLGLREFRLSALLAKRGSPPTHRPLSGSGPSVYGSKPLLWEWDDRSYWPFGLIHESNRSLQAVLPLPSRPTQCYILVGRDVGPSVLRASGSCL